MKKFLIISMTCLALSANVLAAPSSVVQLNSEVKSLLSGFQSGRTKASLTFKELKANSKQALSLAVSALYSKVGSKSEFTVILKNLSYQYGTRPLTKGEGAIKVDFTKITSQEELNQLLPGIETMVNGIASTFAAQYGQAGNLVAKVTDLSKDPQGNYTGLKAVIRFQLDYAKLPAKIQKEDVMFDNGHLEFSMNVTKGVTFKFEMVSNAAYKGFKANEKGLKEYITALLAKDAKVLGEIQTMFRQLDEGAEAIAEGKLL